MKISVIAISLCASLAAASLKADSACSSNAQGCSVERRQKRHDGHHHAESSVTSEAMTALESAASSIISEEIQTVVTTETVISISPSPTANANVTSSINGTLPTPPVQTGPSTAAPDSAAATMGSAAQVVVLVGGIGAVAFGLL